MNIRDFVEFIVQKQFIDEGYNPWTGNHCKRFTQDVFDKVADVKHYEWKRGEMKLKLKMFALIMVVIGVVAAAIKGSRGATAAGMVETAAGRAATAVTTAAVTAYEASVLFFVKRQRIAV